MSDTQTKAAMTELREASDYLYAKFSGGMFSLCYGRDGQRVIWLSVPISGGLTPMLRMIGHLAADRSNPMTWYEAAVLTKFVRGCIDD